MKKIIIGLLFIVGSLFAIELGKIPPQVTLSGDLGEKIDGGTWNSSMIKGKIYILFYVDPDKRDLNNALADALQSRNFNKHKVDSIAVINLAATWIPNAILENILKKKQKKFPDTLYVKDKKKVLVKKWHLSDDNSDILIFDSKGKLIYKKFGKVTKSEIKSIIKLIEKHL